MHCVATKFVPKILTVDKKQQSVDVFQELLQTTSDDATFLSRVITCETAGFEDMTQRQSNNPAVNKSNLTKTKKEDTGEDSNENMLIVCFDIQWIVYKEFVIQGHTVNSIFFCDV